MSAPLIGPDVVRFGNFTLDLRSGELSQNGGEPVLLPYQPFRLLTTLIGQLSPKSVTRDDLRGMSSGRTTPSSTSSTA